MSDGLDLRLAGLKAGDVVTLTRYFSFGAVDTSMMPYGVEVKRRTTKRAYIDKDRYVDLKTGEVHPRYLDYIVRASIP